MICTQCGKPVNDTLQTFGKGNIRLVHCDYCHEITDKYVEYDFVIIFLDLILHRLPVYRHIIFNRTEYCDRGISINYLKIFVVYIFFDAYTKWVCLKEMYKSQDPASLCDTDELEEKPYDRYFLILLMSALEFIVYIVAITLTARQTVKVASSGNEYRLIKWNYLIMSIILSSFGKGFVFLMMIWDYDEKFSNFSVVIDIFVFTSNILALMVFLEVRTLKAVSMAIIGVGAKILFQILTFVFFYDTLKILCLSNFCISV